MDKCLETAIKNIIDYALENGLSVQHVADMVHNAHIAYEAEASSVRVQSQIWGELASYFKMPFEPEKGEKG